MNKKLAIGLFIILPVLVGLIVLNEKRPDWEYNNAEREMRKQLANAHLIGNTPQQVIAYLDQHNISHSPYFSKRCGAPENDKEFRTIQANCGVIAKGFNFRYGPYWNEMLTIFHFDKKNRLQNYEFKQVLDCM